MKKFIIAVAVIFLFCSSAYAADYCDTKYMELINALKKTDKIFDDHSQVFVKQNRKCRVVTFAYSI